MSTSSITKLCGSGMLRGGVEVFRRDSTGTAHKRRLVATARDRSRSTHVQKSRLCFWNTTTHLALVRSLLTVHSLDGA